MKWLGYEILLFQGPAGSTGVRGQQGEGGGRGLTGTPGARGPRGLLGPEVGTPATSPLILLPSEITLQYLPTTERMFFMQFT